MSLRLRLIVLVCAALLISLGLGGAIAYSNARRSVAHEMHAALLVGRQTIENAIRGLRDADVGSRDLDRLVASFDGNRHLRVRLNGRSSALAAPKVERSVFGRVPAWFVGLIGVAAQSDRIPVAIGARDYGTIVIETDPYNETVEVWNDFGDSLVTPALFCALTVLLIYVFIGSALRPLDRLSAAMAEVGDGRYGTRLGGRLPPELARLRDSFNRMAARLAEIDADNRRLNERLLILQKQERSDLARDLHDEVGPFLFAIGIDAARASRLIAQDHADEASGHIQSIGEAVRHVQQHVRRMLARLRPIGIEGLGLREEIDSIVAFWRRRRPEIRYEVAISADCEDLPEPIDATICRVVQEALSNAVRHAEPRQVSIAVARDRKSGQARQEIVVEVADDGHGIADPHRMGYGLIGIGERVGAVGGRLTLANRLTGGLSVTAVLPAARSADRAAATLSAALS